MAAMSSQHFFPGIYDRNFKAKAILEEGSMTNSACFALLRFGG
jgi:hypothetical protein